MRAKRVAVAAGIVVLVLVVGLAWVSSFLWYPGLTPSQSAQILIEDDKFGGRAMDMCAFWGDRILEPLRDASGDFTGLHDHNSFRIGEVLARNDSERSLALATELYSREDPTASLVGAVALAAHGRLPESDLRPGGRIHSVLMDDRYRCRYTADGRRDHDKESFSVNDLELALVAAGHAGSSASVPAILSTIEGCIVMPVDVCAIEALAEIGDPRVVPTLRRWMRSPEFVATPSAFCALVELRDPQAVPLAIERIEPEGGFSPGVVPYLEAVTGESLGHDKASWRRWWARQRNFEPKDGCPWFPRYRKPSS